MLAATLASASATARRSRWWSESAAWTVTSTSPPPTPITSSEPTVTSAMRPAVNPIAPSAITAVAASPTTVSNAYNRPNKRSPALRARILGTARELGYPGPNPAARSLRRGRAGSVGLLFGEALTYVFQDPGAVEFLRGLAEGTARHNNVLQLIAALDADGQEGAALLANAIVDGLVVWSLPERDPLLRLAREPQI